MKNRQTKLPGKRSQEKLQSKNKISKRSTQDKMAHLFQELQAHHIELEVQNEGLRETQAMLEESRNRYSDLYDFAPLGYFTFDRNGFILEVNLTGADQLGMEREQIFEKPFTFFVAQENRARFRAHLAAVFHGGGRRLRN